MTAKSIETGMGPEELERHVAERLRVGLDPLMRYLPVSRLGKHGEIPRIDYMPIGDVDTRTAILIKQTRAWRGKMRQPSHEQPKGRRSRKRFERPVGVGK